MLARITSILPGLALLGAILVVSPAKADEFEKKTVVHVTERLQLPNSILEPGQYVFRLMDNPDRHIVLIYNADGTLLHSGSKAWNRLALRTPAYIPHGLPHTPCADRKD